MGRFLPNRRSARWRCLHASRTESLQLEFGPEGPGLFGYGFLQTVMAAIVLSRDEEGRKALAAPCARRGESRVEMLPVA